MNELIPVDQKISISIVIPVYNFSELTLQCIQSIMKYKPTEFGFEIIVVDNASEDDSKSIITDLQNHIPQLKYIRNDKNYGFAIACNIGAANAEGTMLIFLNNDTIALSGWIESGCETLLSDEKIGIVGAKLLYPDDTIQHAGIVFEERKNHYLPLWPTHIYRRENKDFEQANISKEYPAVTGACLFIRKELFLEVGGFDKNYKMYFEDIDLCFKVAKKELKIVYEPNCVLYHLEGKSTTDTELIDLKNVESSRKFYDQWRQTINEMMERQINNTVYWLAPIFNPSGYASEAIGFALGLEKYIDLVIRHQNKFVSQNFIDNMPVSWRKSLFNLHDVTPEEWNVPINFINKPILIQHQPANAFYKVDEAYYNIGRTMYETDRIPDEWIDKCNMMDEIWVPSSFNKETFIKSGVDDSKIQIIPEGIDTDIFNGDNIEPINLPNRAAFNFLSIFEWTNRKGWDVLLRAYFEAFTKEDDVCLYLRTYLLSHYDGDTKDVLMNKINLLIDRYGYKRETLPRFELLTNQLPFYEMLRLYKAADAFVLPSRGEGWGRPYMEAMSFGIPVIGTNWSGNTEFMNNENSFLIEVHKLTEIKENEIASYIGHCWAEPSKNNLIKLLRQVVANPDAAKQKGLKAQNDIRTKYSIDAVAKIAVERLKVISDNLAKPKVIQKNSKINWEGDQFIYHSLALINRELCSRLIKSNYEVSLDMPPQPNYERDLIQQYPKLAQALNNKFISSDLNICHQWPPKLEAPKSGRWIIIQPWEFGSLPKSWVEAFNNQVDEMWVPSNYVKNVYISSGVDAEKVFVVPNGFDSEKFNDTVKPYKLKSKKKFKFLFVGGTIYRKGIDLLLDAYLKSFVKSDDVCLVIKDMGGNSFYKNQTIKEKLVEIQQSKNLPEIEYIDSNLSEKQLAGLYTACDVLVHPYRGEGFGLPILEAMACGINVIVTKGGSSDDFCNEENSYQIRSQKLYLNERMIDNMETVDYPWLLEPSIDDLIEKMTYTYNNREQNKSLKENAYQYVHKNWTWENTFKIIEDRISELTQKPIFRFMPRNNKTRLEDTEIKLIRLITEAESCLNDEDYMGALKKTNLIFKDFQEHLDNNTEFSQKVFNISGLASLSLNQEDLARKFFEKALHADPTSSIACFGLAQIFLSATQYEAAKTMFEWAIKNDPNNQTAIDSLALANKELGFEPTHNSLEEESA